MRVATVRAIGVGEANRSTVVQVPRGSISSLVSEPESW